MRSRLAVLTLSLCVLLSVVACSKKTDQTTDQAANSSASTQAANTPAPAPEPRKPRVETVTIPAGTTLTVRLGQSVGSKISQPGQSFDATLANAVVLEGKTVIPAGANAQGTVVDAKPLGRFKGGAVLQLQLTSININGTDRSIETSAITETEKGKGKRTAVLAGGGAGLGAVVGALAGGGKGAAIGALAGGGAGTAGAAFTGNKDIVLPAESALSFKLSQPLEVREKE